MRVLLSLTTGIVLVSALFLPACASGTESTRRPDPEQVFERLDSDRDGRISWDEFRDLPARRGTPEERFTAMDSDQDGFLSHEEFLAARPGRDGPQRGGFGGGRRSW